MPKMVTRSIAATLAVLFALCVIALPADAAGIGVGPGTLEIDNALRGEEYERQITLFNLGDDEAAFAFSTTGDAGEWISFFEKHAPDTPIEEVPVPGHGEANVLVRIIVPQDAANGRYEAVVVVNTASDEQVGGSIQTVTLASQVQVSIAVSGTQVLAGTVSIIRTRDIEEGSPLRIEAYFQNTGNVEATPRFAVEVTKDAAATATFNIATTSVRPGASEMIPLECDTASQGCGDYRCSVAVSLDHEMIAAEELAFSILPRGTLTRSGICTELGFDGGPQLGSVSKIRAVFLNDGQMDAKAKLVGEVYHNGTLVDVINGDELLVSAGYSGELVAYVRLENAGRYTIRTHILYEGKRTEVQNLSFDIGSGGVSAVTRSGGGLAWQWVLFGTLVALMLAGLISTYWQRRQKAESAHVKD